MSFFSINKNIKETTSLFKFFLFLYTFLKSFLDIWYFICLLRLFSNCYFLTSYFSFVFLISLFVFTLFQFLNIWNIFFSWAMLKSNSFKTLFLFFEIMSSSDIRVIKRHCQFFIICLFILLSAYSSVFSLFSKLKQTTSHKHVLWNTEISQMFKNWFEKILYM